jgi:tryptophan synthase alpha chain
MNRIAETFNNRGDNKLLSIYFTAGYPQIDDTIPLIKMLQNAGADMVEIGIPFSDPLADGPVIQQSNQMALNNGMTLHYLFKSLKMLRKEIHLPVLLMGYINPVMQMGMENFCQNCAACGIDGLILPDLPVKEYNKHYKKIFKQYGLLPVFLATPETQNNRLSEIDEASAGFVYLLSATSITGQFDKTANQNQDALHQLQSFPFKHPTMTGFGIKDRSSFEKATVNTAGGIIGTAFIDLLKNGRPTQEKITSFIQSIKPIKKL